MLINLGFLSAIISLFIVPEIFGSVAIILGAYAWRMEGPNSHNLGLFVIIVGIICMLMGIYYTSYFGLYNILP
jgi:membrane-bound ClpP family serine protease